MIKIDRDIPDNIKDYPDIKIGDNQLQEHRIFGVKQNTQQLMLELINPKDFNMSNIVQTHITLNDIWAEGTGEGMRCDHCDKTYSKPDIFNSDLFPELQVSSEVFRKTFIELQALYVNKILECPICEKGTLREILGEEHINSLINKYKHSVQAFLVVLKDQNNEYYGFAEGYVDTFENIYHNDLHRYFQRIGIDSIRERIINILGNIPQNMLIISGVGIRNLPEFSGPMKMNNTFRLFSNLFQMIAENNRMYPGIMLLDKNHPFMHHIFSMRDGISLELEKYVDISKITNLSPTYDPDIMIFSDSKKSFDYTEYKSSTTFFKKHGMPTKKTIY